MKIASLKEKIIGLFATKPHIGSLEISHASLKYLLIKGAKSIQQASLKLPPGVIEQGKPTNGNQLITALKTLHNQIAPANNPVSVVLVIPSSLVYVQAFSVPIMAPAEQEEAIDLNLQMISPVKIDEAYYDWQEIKKNESAGHVDLLGAFTNAAIIDQYMSALSEANFNVVSVEFPGLSLSRLVKEKWQVDVPQQLLIYLNSEGFLSLILRNENLYFSHFTSWTDIVSTSKEREISFTDIQDFTTQEIQRVLAFYLGKTGRSITDTILISPMFNYEIVQIAQEKLDLSVKNLTISELPDLSANWFPALGAALRGAISRSKDAFLSLSQISAKAEYYHERALTLVALCRNIVVGALVFVFISYLTVDAIFYHYSLSSKMTPTFSAPINATEVGSLRTEAQAFNKLVTLAHAAKKTEANWSPIFENLKTTAGTTITLSRVFADRNNLTLIVNGTATNELAAINFKGRVERIANVKSASLPLSQIKQEGPDSVSFTLTVVLTSL